LEGTGGPGGWPTPGCRCASCGRVAAADHRRPIAIVLDERVQLAPSEARRPATRLDYLTEVTPDGWAITGLDGGRLLVADPLPEEHLDGGALSARPPRALDSGESARPPHIPDSGGTASRISRSAPAEGSRSGDARAEPFDLVLIDLLDRPERLGDLRRQGLVTERTQVVAVRIDHRIPSEAELDRRLAYWGATAVPDGTVLDTGEPAPAARPWPRRTLLLGGSRSGKSQEAELRLAGEPDVTYVATGPSGGDDPSWLARIEAHRERRPAHWRTVETVRAADLVHLLRTSTGTLLVDGLGTWIASVFDEHAAWPGQDADRGGPASGRSPLDRVGEQCDELVAAWRQTTATVVAVSDEVGMGVVPATASGRLFRDALGRLNQRLAAESDEVALVVAGRLLPL
jgi:adenosylcobinamide kinase/adenosylcobinamide-phosphate guanylyltransferase